MSAYIPLIKTTKWIDLSSDHKKLRSELELDTLSACVNKEQLQPIMLQGAFGIGKTNSLYYLFHYGWCILKTPTFLVSLDELTKTIRNFALVQPTRKIQNSDLGPFINQLLASQIESLKNPDWTKLELLYFPEFKGGDLTKYLNDFKTVEIIEDTSKGSEHFPSCFSAQVIREAIDSGNRPLLLIDEFESKFYELKKYIETSGGGVLRELFDQIVQDLSLFYLVIGNGPASGYEIAKERGDESSDSETAANRRLKTKPIPFPTASLLQRSFLKGDPKGYINFIWWLSRCRPGHILKLRDALGSFDELSILSTNELITKAIFREPIDEGGEAVSYLKTAFFNQIPGRIQAAILGKLISNFKPVEFDIKAYKQELKECVPFFYCATNLVNSDMDLLSVLRDDLYSIHLKKFEEEGKYDSLNYIEHLQPYFSYILNGISDNEGNIAFGMINDSKPDEVLAETFIIPLLELTYDFISLYQDDSLREIRETLDFLLNIINQITTATEQGDLETFLPHTSDLFEKCKLLRNEKVYLQLSLFSIRESVEQPIGSPRLKYKNEHISSYLSNLDLQGELPLIYQKENNLLLYIIPDLADELLAKYLNNLEIHLNSIFYDKFHKDGDLVTRVVYLNRNEKIEEFAKSFLYQDGDTEKPEPIFTLRKIDVVDIETYQLNFSSQIIDYIDSVAKIGIIGRNNKELNISFDLNENSLLEIKKIINVVGERPWTEKKETIRTIEHYRKLLFDGDNSILRAIYNFSIREYKTKLAEYVKDEKSFKTNLHDYYYFDKIVLDETEAYDKYSSSIALIYLLENKSVDESVKQLLELCKNEYRFDIDKDNPDRAINFKSVLNILTKDKGSLTTHFQEFDFNSEFISSLFSLSRMLLCENELTNISDCYSFLKDSSENSFFRSYHRALGGYLTSDLSVSLYKLAYLSTLDKIGMNSEISNKVSELESSLAEVRVGIVTKLDELKIVLDESQNMSAYPEKLSKMIKGLTLIKNILDNNHNYGELLLVNSIVEHFKKVAADSKRFYQQLNSIYNSINDQKEKVDDIQEEIDNLYNDPLTEKLLGFDYPVKRSEQYLWKKIFLSGNLKTKEEYEKLFGQSRNYYNPFTSPIIFPDVLKNFQHCLIAVYNKVSPTFTDLLTKMKEKQSIAENTKELESYIDQLLTVNEE